MSAACQSAAQGGTAWAHIDTGEYPGLFYKGMHVFTHLGSPTVAVLAMRVANVLLATLIIGTLALINGRTFRRLVTYSIAASMVPLGMFIVPSTNPSSWALIGVTGTYLGLFAAVHNPSRRAGVLSASLAVLSAVVGAGARGDAGVFVVGAVGLVVVQSFRSALRSLSFLAAGTVVALIGLASALSSAQVGADRTPSQAGALAPDAIVNSILNVPGFLFGVWGSWALGWLDTGMPAGVTVAASLVGAGLLFLGLERKDLSSGIGLLGVVATFLAVPTLMLLSVRYSYGSWVQPRYVLPLVPLLFTSALVTSRAGTVARYKSMAASLTTIAMLSYANSAALFTVLGRYTMGAGARSLLGQHEWWWSIPVGPRIVWIIGSVAFLVALWPVVTTSRPIETDSATAKLQRPPQRIPVGASTASSALVDPASSAAADSTIEPLRPTSSDIPPLDAPSPKAQGG